MQLKRPSEHMAVSTFSLVSVPHLTFLSFRGCPLCIPRHSQCRCEAADWCVTYFRPLLLAVLMCDRQVWCACSFRGLPFEMRLTLFASSTMTPWNCWLHGRDQAPARDAVLRPRAR